MTSLIIRDLDDRLSDALRLRAARHGQSVEAEARQILQSALAARQTAPDRKLAEQIRGRFASLGGIELNLAARDTERAPPDFEAC
jgi:plasmid stability protein